jgi:hypothetical protein
MSEHGRLTKMSIVMALLFVISLYLLSCASSENQEQEIIIANFNNEYNNKDSVKFKIKSNVDDSIFFSFDGLCHSLRGWQGFDNNLLTNIKSHDEVNYLLTPLGEYSVRIDPAKFRISFPASVDSFKIAIYYTKLRSPRRSVLYTENFTLKELTTVTD